MTVVPLSDPRTFRRGGVWSWHAARHSQAHTCLGWASLPPCPLPARGPVHATRPLRPSFQLLAPSPGPGCPRAAGPRAGPPPGHSLPASCPRVLPAGPARGTCPRVLPEGPRTARPDSSQHSGVPTSAPAVWPRQGTPVLLCRGPRPDLPITRVGAPRPFPGLAPAPCPSQRSDPPMGCQPHPATPTASDTAAWPVGTLLFLPSRRDTCSPSHTATLSPVSTSTCLQNTQMTRRTLHPPATTLRPTATQEHRLELGSPPRLPRGCHQALSPTSCVCLRLCPAPATALRPPRSTCSRWGLRTLVHGSPSAPGAPSTSPPRTALLGVPTAPACLTATPHAHCNPPPGMPPPGSPHAGTAGPPGPLPAPLVVSMCWFVHSLARRACTRHGRRRARDSAVADG